MDQVTGEQVAAEQTVNRTDVEHLRVQREESLERSRKFGLAHLLRYVMDGPAFVREWDDTPAETVCRIVRKATRIEWQLAVRLADDLSKGEQERISDLSARLLVTDKEIASAFGEDAAPTLEELSSKFAGRVLWIGRELPPQWSRGSTF